MTEVPELKNVSAEPAEYCKVIVEPGTILSAAALDNTVLFPAMMKLAGVPFNPTFSVPVLSRMVVPDDPLAPSTALVPVTLKVPELFRKLLPVVPKNEFVPSSK